MFKDICINSKSCELMKSVNKPKYGSRTILTVSCWEYVALFLKRQPMAGASNALFYWEQAYSFYLASQKLPDNAKTDEEICPNNVYQMSGNQITVRTLDLNLPFDEIAKTHFNL